MSEIQPWDEHRPSLGTTELMNHWNEQTERETEGMIKSFKDGDQETINVVHKMCSYYPDTVFYKEGNTEVVSYRICCQLVDYCSYYKQIWFYLVCQAVAFLIIIILIVVSCYICYKTRPRRGKKLEDSERSSCSEQSNSTN